MPALSSESPNQKKMGIDLDLYKITEAEDHFEILKKLFLQTIVEP
jgi:hypothetical protein